MPDREIKLLITSDGKAAITGINAVNQAAKDMQTQHQGIADGLKSAWVGVAAQFYLVEKAIQVARTAVTYMEQGAKAMQAEEAFKNAAQSYHVNAEAMLSDLKRLTAGTIDDSDLMQKAFKGMSAGLSPETMLEIAEISRVAARRTGQDVSEAYNNIADAVETMRARGLVNYNLLTREEARWIESIKAAGREYNMMPLIMARLADQQRIMGQTTDNASEALQRHRAQIKELAETIGKDLVNALGAAVQGYHSLEISFLKAMSSIMPENDAAKKRLAELTGGAAAGPGMSATDSEAVKNAEDAKLKALAFTNQTLALTKAFGDYQKSVEALNPWLTEYEKKLIDINQKAKDLLTTYQEKNMLSDKVKADVEVERVKAEQYLRQEQSIKNMEAASKGSSDTRKLIKELDANILAGERDLLTVDMERQTKELEYWDKTDAHTGPAALAIKYDWQRRMLELSLQEINAKYKVEEGDVEDVRANYERAAVLERIKNSRLYEAREIMDLQIQREQMLLEVEKERFDNQLRLRQTMEGQISAMQSQAAGAAGPGFSQLSEGLTGIAKVGAGQDQYSIDLEKTRIYWQEKVLLWQRGKASMEQVDAAYTAYSAMNAQKEANVRLQYASFAAQATLGILSGLDSALGGHNLAIFAMQKAVAIAMTLISAHASAAAAVAPPPLGLGPVLGVPLAAKMLTFGYLQAAMIAATSIMQAVGGTGGGSIDAGSTGVGTYSQPAVIASSPSQAEAQRTQSITVNVYGNVVDHDKFARELVKPIQKALAEGAH